MVCSKATEFVSNRLVTNWEAAAAAIGFPAWVVWAG